MLHLSVLSFLQDSGLLLGVFYYFCCEQHSPRRTGLIKALFGTQFLMQQIERALLKDLIRYLLISCVDMKFYFEFLSPLIFLQFYFGYGSWSLLHIFVVFHFCFGMFVVCVNSSVLVLKFTFVWVSIAMIGEKFWMTSMVSGNGCGLVKSADMTTSYRVL